jgi:cytochrome c553
MLRTILAVTLIGSAQAAPTTSDGNRLFAPCVVCHQPNAWGSPDGSIPNLAGQLQRYLETQLGQFASGARVDTAMQVVTAHPRSNAHAEFAAISTYLSALAWNPAPVRGSGEHLRVGQELYTHICAACHAPDGRGQASNRVPRIAGQHYPYLRRQVEEAARLHRDLAPAEMISALRDMRESEKDALADYVSRLGNTDALVDPERSRHPNAQEYRGSAASSPIFNAFK